MAEDVGHHSTGLNPGNVSLSALTWSHKPKSNQGKRVILIREEDRAFEKDDHVYLRVSPMKGKCLRVPDEAVDTSQIQIEPDLTYEEKPIKVLDQKQRSTRRKTVNFYKVQWSNHSEEEATWETEGYLQTKYLGFLQSTPNKYVK
ncbi:hypothetical protein U9M48_024554 [Paspalum notatum var. saurae]|uniref:Chromo domain-containing protein n=1 Tax=Paspalum notatum var. saurae TaxID=547442 RepID=A0AAQ3TM00_PASNO